MVEDIAVDHEGEYKAEEHIDDFDGVVACDVTVGYCGHSVDAPVQGVQVLDAPWLVDDPCVSCRRVQPAELWSVYAVDVDVVVQRVEK